MAGEFWLNDERFVRLAPLLQADTRGVPQVDDWRVISGIVHVPISGGRWSDAPEPVKIREGRSTIGCAVGEEGRLAARLQTLAASGGPPAERMLDSIWARAHGWPPAEKGGARQRDRPLARRTHDQAARDVRWA